MSFALFDKSSVRYIPKPNDYVQRPAWLRSCRAFFGHMTIENGQVKLKKQNNDAKNHKCILKHVQKLLLKQAGPQYLEIAFSRKKEEATSIL